MARRRSNVIFELSHRPYEQRTKQFDEGFEKGNGSDDAYAFSENGAASQSAGVTAAAAANWRAGKSLKKLRDQLDAAFPNRSKASDGFIGDTAHCPGGSDHCPNIVEAGVGIVTAFDATNDPAHGCDINAVVEAIRADKDERIKYIIWRRRICSSYDHNGVAAWTWRPYNGGNPHDKHAHFSVVGKKALYDGAAAWVIG